MNERTDAALVMAARSGERAAIASIYDRYASALYDVCCRIGSTDDAADAVHDTFVSAMDTLDQLRDPAKLKPWLFAIARNRVRRRGRDREYPAEMVDDTPGDLAAPETEAIRSEQAVLVSDALAGLVPEDRELVLMRDRYGIDGNETAEILGIERAAVDRRLHGARRRLRQSVVACRVAAPGTNQCDELTALRGEGTLNPTVRKRVNRHIENCPQCTEEAERTASPTALLGSVAFLAPPALLRDRVLGSLAVADAGPPTAHEATLSSEPTKPSESPQTDTGSTSHAARSPLAGTAVAVGAAVAVAAIAAGAWFGFGPGAGDEVATGTPAASSETTTTAVPGRGVATSTPTSRPTTTVLQTTAPPATTPKPGFCDLLDEAVTWWQANQGPASPAPGDVEAYFTGSLSRLQALVAVAPQSVHTELEAYATAMAGLVAQLQPGWNLAAAGPSTGDGLAGLRGYLESTLPAQC